MTMAPTVNRNDDVLVAPISIYDSKTALSRQAARNLLGIDQSRPAVLVQLGVGEADLNAKMTAALSGLLNWPNLQVVLTKEPIDANGNQLAPAGLDIKIIRHFPLANVLAAFDAAICAAGYNSVHEELAAKIPTLFIPNIRGTDNQVARAAWAADNQMALSVDQSDLKQITAAVAQLAVQSVRDNLASNCKNLPDISGGQQVSNIFKELINQPTRQQINLGKTLLKLKVQDTFGRGLRGFIYSLLQLLTMVYRWIKPHKDVVVNKPTAIKLVEGEVSDLSKIIKSGEPFEHLLTGASDTYKSRRTQIASAAYLK